MGRASRRKRDKKADRPADAHKFRFMVCAYPDVSVAPVVDLLKAATLYGDEVVLHHSTATMLAAIASVGALDHADLVKTIADLAPYLGDRGGDLERAMVKLETDHGTGAAEILGALLDSASPLRAMISAFDPLAGRTVAEHQQQLVTMRSHLDDVIEEKLVAARIDELMPAIDRGLLTLAPVEERDDFFEAYIDALWAVLSDSRYYPLLDNGIAKLVHAAVREGRFDPPGTARSRGRQAGAVHEFLARLPTFPGARMEEIVDIRDELRSPLTVFRSEMVKVAREMTMDAFDPAFVHVAEEAWVERVAPALAELDDLIKEKRLHRQFGQPAASGGAIGAVGGLITGLVTQEAVLGGSIAASAGVASTVVTTMASRRRIASEIRRRPYLFLYRTEKLLTARSSA